MKISIITLFPAMFKGPFDESIVKRAIDKSLVEIEIHDLRRWGEGKRRVVDDRPYGGGVGMILKPDVIQRAVEDIKKQNKAKRAKVVLLDAGGERFTQKKAEQLSKVDHLILIAGHYEGVDFRVHETVADEVISIGDYVLTGGEIPAMAVTDSIIRLIPKVLEKEQATRLESFSENTLEYPQYTRPENFKGSKVPQVLLSGNHTEIEKFRKQKALEKTKKVRPDLA